jgi:hypothetical protein
MSRIFICYRREDSSGHAGRLYDRLRAHFDADEVFMDIDAIDPGVDYLELIDRTIDTVDVLIVLIGPHWLAARDPTGSRRLDDPEDLVRLEITAALDRNIRVIPVLVQSATMPHPRDLPPAITGLARRNAIEISDGRWDYDAERLVRALRGSLAARQAEAAPAPQAEAPAAPRVSPLPQPETPPEPRKPSALPQAPAGGEERLIPRDGVAPALSVVLAISGALMVLIWGAFVSREWHYELWGIRTGAGVILVVLAAAGLWSKKWGWVLAAGIAGLVGLALWMFRLLGTGHTVHDLLAPEKDGIRNGLTWAGALLVLVAGWIGAGARTTRREPD